MTLPVSAASMHAEQLCKVESKMQQSTDYIWDKDPNTRTIRELYIVKPSSWLNGTSQKGGVEATKVLWL